MLDTADWDTPARLGIGPVDYAERHDLVAAVRRAVEEDLTEWQRQVFIAIAGKGRSARRAGGAAGFQP